MFKKLLIILAMVALLAAPVMATDSYYYSDEAVSGGYTQGQIPVQGVVANGAIAYGDFGASADLVILQALPMTQQMFGVGNAGTMTHNTHKSESTQINFDKINLSTTGGWEGYDYYYGYNHYSVSVYNPNYSYYYYPIYSQNGYGPYDISFGWTSFDFYKNSYESSNLVLPLPATLEVSATQAASNSVTFENGPMKLKMDQSAMQAGSLKVTGYGISNGTGCVY